ncbi:MAG: response regulator [Phycisphaerales bacterium]|jgi:two-component system cell cycle response regulator
MSERRDITEPLDADLDETDLTSATLLLVDDNQQNLELMQAWLEPLGCTLQIARDGAEALEVAARHVPDLVLLDVMMPRMSGFEACRRLKDASATRDTVIIMVTALNEVGDFERAVECGCDDFLTKPVNKLELTTRVKSLLRVRLLKRKVDALLRERREG